MQKEKTRKLKIREALKLITDEEASKLINDEELKLRAVQNVEQNGIVFLDEIDKITSRSETSGADVSRQGFSETCCRWSRALPFPLSME